MFESFSAFGFFVHTPCGPRKSGIPDSVEMPAPVTATTRRAPTIHWATSSMVDEAAATTPTYPARVGGKTPARPGSPVGEDGAVKVHVMTGGMELRAIFRAFRGDEPLHFEGEHYRFSLLPPLWSPGDIPVADPPIDVAAVNPWMLRMAGEHADGVHVHPLNTETYYRETVLPNLDD